MNGLLLQTLYYCNTHTQMQISLVGEEERGFGKQQEPRMNGVRPGKL